MTELELTGGAKIGMVNTTVPLATLKVNKDRLELNVSIVGNFIFQRSDIISIEPYTIIPIIGQGIKINHRVSTYKEKVIFWTFKNPKLVIRQIQKTGFLSKENNLNQEIDRAIIEKQAKNEFPIKKSFIIGAIVMLNLLLLADIIPFFLEKKEAIPIGNGTLTAFGLFFLAALLSLVSPDFRRLTLKEGRKLNDIKKVAIFIMIISGLMLLCLGLVMKLLN